MICAVCRGELKKSRAGDASVPDMIRFCSRECLMRYIRSMSPLSDAELTRIGTHVSDAGQDLSGAALSCKLNRRFRSVFEVVFAEAMVFLEKEKVYYEPHMLRVGKRSWYVPDFFFPDYCVWVETKGVWYSGGKRKFLAARDIVGRDRMLLLPVSCFPWFASKSVLRGL